MHERTLKTVNSDFKSSFIDNDGSFMIHQKMFKVQQLKFINTDVETILGEVFLVNKTVAYDIRMRNELYTRNPKTVRYGTKTISFLSPKSWALIPQNIKDPSPCHVLKRVL